MLRPHIDHIAKSVPAKSGASILLKQSDFPFRLIFQIYAGIDANSIKLSYLKYKIHSSIVKNYHISLIVSAHTSK